MRAISSAPMRTGTPRTPPPAAESVTKGLEAAQVGDDRVDLVRIELLAERRHPHPVDALRLGRRAIDPERDPVLGLRGGQVLEVLAHRALVQVQQARPYAAAEVGAMARGARRRDLLD